jgi:hypothetical protein
MGSPKAHTRYWGNPVELLHFSHLNHVSLVQWINHLLPARRGSGPQPGVQPTLWNWDYLLAMSRYNIINESEMLRLIKEHLKQIIFLR